MADVVLCVKEGKVAELVKNYSDNFQKRSREGYFVIICIFSDIKKELPQIGSSFFQASFGIDCGKIPRPKRTVGWYLCLFFTSRRFS